MSNRKRNESFLQLDVNIMKEEMGDGTGGGGGGGGGSGALELKQQSAQNEKLRQTLVNMRDLMAHEKNVAMKMTKDLEEKTAEGAELAKHNAKLTSQVRLDGPTFDQSVK